MNSGEQQPRHRSEISGAMSTDSYHAQNLRTIQKFASVPTPSAPRGLPASMRDFVNRASETHTVATVVAGDDSPIVMISGRPGVGASCFAVQWGHWHEDMFPDGTLYHDMREDQASGGTALAGVLGKFLESYGCDVPTDLAMRKDRYRRSLRDKRVLVVLDHVKDPAEIEALRPTAPGSALLATCNYLGDFAAEQRDLRMEPFDYDSARQLVVTMLGEERVTAAESEIVELIRLCEGVPSLLRMAVGRMKRNRNATAAQVVGWLRAELDRAAEPDRAAIWDIVVGAAHRSLSPDAARIYRMLGCHPGLEVSEDAIYAVCESVAAHGFDVITELCDRHLLEPHSAGRYRLSRLVRAHARNQARNIRDAENQALLAWTRWYVNRAQTADVRFIPDRNRVFRLDGVAAELFDSDQDAMAWLEAERHNLLELQRQLVERGWSDSAMRLGEAMWTLYIGALYLEDWWESSQLSLAAAVAAHHIVAEVRFRAFLARALMENAPNVADPVQAYQDAGYELDKAWELPVSGRGLDYRASAIEFKGRLHSYQGHYEEAIDCYRRAKELFEQRAADTGAPDDERAANRRGVALQNQFIGRALLDRGKYGQAVESLRQAESGLVGTSHYRDVAKVRTQLGEALRRHGDTRGAHRALTQAVNALDGKRWRRVETEALWQLSFVAVERELPDVERFCLERLRERYSVTQSPRLDQVKERLARLSGG